MSPKYTACMHIHIYIYYVFIYIYICIMYIYYVYILCIYNSDLTCKYKFDNMHIPKHVYIYIFPNTTGMFRNFRILWASEKAQRLLFWTDFFGLQGSKPKILPWRKIGSIHIFSSSYKSYKCIVIKHLHKFHKKVYCVNIHLYIYIEYSYIYTLKNMFMDIH